MNRIIQFTNDNVMKGSSCGWFDFDPIRRLGWSFEETLARILGKFNEAERDEVLNRELEKSCFLANLTMNGFPFTISDWYDDRRISVHVPMPPGKPPMGFTKAEFIVALRVALQGSPPITFSVNHPNGEETVSYPPTPFKLDAIKLAKQAFEEVVITGSDKLPKKVIKLAMDALAGLEAAF